eukprot:1188986-Prorocentrum_minimum.AAC.1
MPCHIRVISQRVTRHLVACPPLTWGSNIGLARLGEAYRAGLASRSASASASHSAARSEPPEALAPPPRRRPREGGAGVRSLPAARPGGAVRGQGVPVRAPRHGAQGAHLGSPAGRREQRRPRRCGWVQAGGQLAGGADDAAAGADPGAADPDAQDEGAGGG